MKINKTRLLFVHKSLNVKSTYFYLILQTQISSKTSEHVLYQNAPNPFSGETTIKYFLSSNVKTAMLNIYDMQGTQIKSYQLHNLGDSEIKINASELNSGMYLYALIADGMEIDVKRMILTD